MMEIVLGLLFCWGLLWVGWKAFLIVFGIIYWAVGGGQGR
jgi:hypothetical protein